MVGRNGFIVKPLQPPFSDCRVLWFSEALAHYRIIYTRALPDLVEPDAAAALSTAVTMDV